MLFDIIILAFSSSVDSFGIGITYGLRKTVLTISSKFILFVISLIVTFCSVFIGRNLSYIFTPETTRLIGSLILVVMGLIIIFQILTCKKNNTPLTTISQETQKQCLEKKVYQFFIKFLGITIQIIKDPISSDFDSSCKIDTKEAIYLGIALSIDSFCIGIGSSILGANSLLFPILVALFQFIFLSIGTAFGKKINKVSKIPNNIWNLISGILLIIIGISRII